MNINDQHFLRYQRQIMLPEITELGQKALLKATVLIVGAGGLANAVAPYLAASGVGHLIIADGDQIERSNLQRQIMFQEQKEQQNKAMVLCKQLEALNSEIRYTPLPYYLNNEILQQEVLKADLVLDCSDNLDTRYQVNQASIILQKVLISGAAIRWQGQLITFDFTKSRSELVSLNQGCYQCFRPETHTVTGDEERCTQSGIMGPVVGVIGLMQALVAIKQITKAGKVQHAQLQQFDGLSMQWQQFKIPKNINCPACNLV